MNYFTKKDGMNRPLILWQYVSGGIPTAGGSYQALSDFPWPEVRTFDDLRPKALFAGVFALYTMLIVAHSVLIVEEQAVFLFFLVAYSWDIITALTLKLNRRIREEKWAFFAFCAVQNQGVRQWPYPHIKRALYAIFITLDTPLVFSVFRQLTYARCSL